MSTGVRQAIRILELLAPHPEGLRVSEVAEQLGVNRAIPFRLMNLLAELGYVRQHPLTERYHATFRLGALGLRQIEHSRLSDWAQQPLNELASVTKELVRLGVATGRGLQWLAKAQGAQSALTVDSASGADAVLHATASGKAWLATWPTDEFDEYLQSVDLSAQTEATITDPAVLREIVEEARLRGFALTNGEMDVGISAVAVPIPQPDPSSPSVGTVSVAGPTARLGTDELISFVPHLQNTAAILASHWPVFASAEAAWPPVQG